jgi:hypothetical protein
MTDRHIVVLTTVLDADNALAVLSETSVEVVVPAGAPPIEPEPPEPDAWSVEIVHGGRTYEVKQDQATDMGDFTSHRGGFIQRCFKAQVSELAMTIFFRPDVDDEARQEIVFERGYCWLAGTEADIGAYRAVVWKGTDKIADVEVPHHYLFSRWRWQSASRPIVCSIDDLHAARLIPPYVFDPARPPVAKLVPYAPMGLAGIYPQMGDAGERPDIGPMTDPQGEYLVTGNQTALDVVRAQAEAAGTCQWHMRDENTCAPIDFETYPEACWYQGQQQGTPFIPVPPGLVKVDNSHQPALAYLPYLLTGDPYHLETLQFQATWNYGRSSVGYRPSLGETRAWAWDTRTLGQCVQMTPEEVPSWLLPQSYWRYMADKYRAHFDGKYLLSTDPVHTYFRCTDNLDSRVQDGLAPAGTWQQPWQTEFLACMFGWLIGMGQEEWRAEFDWLIAGVIARTLRDGGWPRAQCTPYQMMLKPAKGAPACTTWEACWLLNHDVLGLDYDDVDTWVAEDMTYLTYTRGALACTRLVDPSTDEAYRWASDQLKQGGWTPAFKWSIGERE